MNNSSWTGVTIFFCDYGFLEIYIQVYRNCVLVKTQICLIPEYLKANISNTGFLI